MSDRIIIIESGLFDGIRKYNIGEVWWTRFSFEDSDEDKNVE